MSGFEGPVVIEQTGEVTWTLAAPLVYRGRWQRFEVLAGFGTDLASTPRVLSWLAPRSGRYTPPAVLHDCLWRVAVPAGRITYRDADGLLRRAMRELEVPFCQRWLMWAAVRWGALTRPGGHIGWWRDAPPVLVWTLLALPVVVPPAVLVAVALLVVQVAELVAWVALRLFSRRERVVAPVVDPRA